MEQSQVLLHMMSPLDSVTLTQPTRVASGAVIQLNFRGIFNVFKSLHLEVNMEISDMNLDL